MPAVASVVARTNEIAHASNVRKSVFPNATYNAFCVSSSPVFPSAERGEGRTNSLSPAFAAIAHTAITTAQNATGETTASMNFLTVLFKFYAIKKSSVIAFAAVD